MLTGTARRGASHMDGVALVAARLSQAGGVGWRYWLWKWRADGRIQSVRLKKKRLHIVTSSTV